jgi:hypothetical protein
MVKGRYDQAINVCKKKLMKANKKDKHIIILEESFQKAVSRDKGRAEFLLKENRDENMVEVMNIYKRLKSRQDRIKGILPLEIISEGRNANINIENYDNQLIAAKEKAVKFLYDNSIELLAKNDKMLAREAYDKLIQVDKIYSNYKNTHKLLNEAKAKGMTNVLLKVHTAGANVVLPTKLDNELKKTELHGLNKEWITYYNKPQNGMYYDYDIIVNFDEIFISPNSEKIKETSESKEVSDGYQYVLDDNGNVQKDTSGNDIKIAKFKTITASIRQSMFHKDGFIKGNVNYYNNVTNQLIRSVPFSNTMIYHHDFIELTAGDAEAMSDETKVKFGNKNNIPHPGWPTDEFLIMEASEGPVGIKQKVRAIIYNKDYMLD